MNVLSIPNNPDEALTTEVVPDGQIAIIGFKQTATLEKMPLCNASNGQRKELRKINERIKQVFPAGTFDEDPSIESTVTSNPNGNGVPERFSVLRYQDNECPVAMLSMDKGAPEDFEHIELLSGCCLFSNGSIKAMDRNGDPVYFLNPKMPINTPIQAIITGKNLSFFEIESTERLTSTIAALLQNPTIGERQPTLSLDIPKGEYYLYLADAYNKGFVPRDVALKYFDAVDARCSKLTGFIEAILQKKLGANTPPVQRTGMLDPIATAIKAAVTPGERIDLSTLKTLLNGTLPLPFTPEELESISSFTQLSYTGYSQTYLGKVLEKPSTMLITVENPSERHIAVQAQRVLKSMQEQTQQQITSIYPLELYKPANIEELVTQPPTVKPANSSAYFMPNQLTNSQLKEFYHSQYPYLK